MGLRFKRLSLCTMLALLCASCDGGLMGTGTGPSQQPNVVPGTITSEVPKLPTKIAPSLPRSITGERNVAQSSQLQSNAARALNSFTSVPLAAKPKRAIRAATSQTSAKTQAAIQPSMQLVEATRIEVQEMLILLDSEFDNILSGCETQLNEDRTCEINAGQIRAFYDDSVTRKMIAVYATADAKTALSDIEENNEITRVREIYTALEGTEVVFNKVSMQPLNTAEKTFQLTVSSDDLLQGRELQLRWDKQYNQITYDIRQPDVENNQESYSYRSNPTGQRLTAKHKIVNTEATDFSVVITAQANGSGNVLYNGRLDDYHVSGQANNETAYVYSRDFNDEQDTHLREVFDVFGDLISSYECLYESDFWCDENGFKDEFSDYHLSDEEYYEYTGELGFNEIEIENLPADVIEFLIVENTPDIPIFLRDEYCDGWQPYPGELEIFCFADEFAPQDVVVVSIDGAEPVLIPEASVVVRPIQ